MCHRKRGERWEINIKCHRPVAATPESNRASCAGSQQQSESWPPVKDGPEKRVEELVSDRAYKIIVTPVRV